MNKKKMKKQKLQTLKGFRDFLPEEMAKRKFVLEKIRCVFEKHGFEEMQTPTLEYANVILGKYGEEADRLVYSFEDRGKRRVALPYDLTVPTSRVLAQYKSKLPKYFRRYQIQNVFRADKPQKGRYREFTQCDIDIFGTSSALADAEILACVYAAFSEIGLGDVVIRVNDRQVLFDKLRPFENARTDVLRIIRSVDKLDKNGEEEVIGELVEAGLEPDKAMEALDAIKKAKASTTLEKVIEYAEGMGVPKNRIRFEPTLARGLDYYTGMIMEVVVGKSANSLGGGGRYDNLIEKLSGESIKAVGFSFGLDRVVEEVLKKGLLWGKLTKESVLITVFDEKLLVQSIKVAKKLREEDVKTELFPDPGVKLEKQIKYADKKGIAWVVIIGPEEMSENKVVLKNLDTGKQEKVVLEELVSKISK